MLSVDRRHHRDARAPWCIGVEDVDRSAVSADGRICLSRDQSDLPKDGNPYVEGDRVARMRFPLAGHGSKGASAVSMRPAPIESS